MRMFARTVCALVVVYLATLSTVLTQSRVGREAAIPQHLRDGEEFTMPLRDLLAYGKRLFSAVWTIQDGGGRPRTKGTGAPLSDAAHPLEFPQNFNRISGPDANSCAGCHNPPYGIAGGGGDFVTNVFVLGQRFDFVTFDPQRHGADARLGRRERGKPVSSDRRRIPGDDRHVRRRLSRDAGAADHRGPAGDSRHA